jgi:hypothetical protein
MRSLRFTLPLPLLLLAACHEVGGRTHAPATGASPPPRSRYVGVSVSSLGRQVSSGNIPPAMALPLARVLGADASAYAVVDRERGVLVHAAGLLSEPSLLPPMPRALSWLQEN